MIYQKIDEIAKKNSNKIALFCNDKKYSYQELIHHVNLLSKAFSNTKQSALIYLPKSEWIVIGQLAINKTKNIFTCLDIDTPRKRVIEIINQLQAKWIISSEFFGDLGYEKKEIYENFFIWEKQTDKLYFDENISHIYFSSGSTGKPKGIKLSDIPLVDVVLQQARMIHLNKNKKFAWLLSPSFDASLSDIYMTLCVGAELHICQFSQKKIKTLHQYFQDYQITHSDISPSILPFLKIENLFLEAIIFGGEIGNEDVIQNLSKKVKMFNAYGPTEATICTSLKKINKNWNSHNIGKPLMGVEYWIGNHQELYIAGNHLCIGYLSEELNQKKFMNQNGKRYYKSGDLVEYKNQEYFYKGRLDRQFKYHGILISPEEIEYLAKKFGCREALCTNIGKYKIYYTGKIKEKKLKELFLENIPKEMMPQEFIVLKNFDTNIHGKIIINENK